ncbi:unnamed protein product [Arctogadus glacialis]
MSLDLVDQSSRPSVAAADPPRRLRQKGGDPRQRQKQSIHRPSFPPPLFLNREDLERAGRREERCTSGEQVSKRHKRD